MTQPDHPRPRQRTWTWAEACAVFDKDEPELRRWIDTLNRQARDDGRREPIQVSDDGGAVTWVGSPDPEDGAR
jgi:hypothetical protein